MKNTKNRTKIIKKIKKQKLIPINYLILEQNKFLFFLIKQYTKVTL